MEDSLLGKLFWKVMKQFVGRLRSVWIMDSNGENQRPLLELAAESKHADFSPDGEAIAFESDLTGKDQIYIVDAKGDNLRQLTHEGTNFKPVFRPTSR